MKEKIKEQIKKLEENLKNATEEQEYHTLEVLTELNESFGGDVVAQDDSDHPPPPPPHK